MKATKKAATAAAQKAVVTPQANGFDICRDAIKIKWSFGGQGYGNAHSDTVEHSAASANGADKDSIIGQVVLIQRKDTAPIHAIARLAKAVLHSFTVPWEDGGWRLLRSADYGTVEQRFAEFTRQYRDEVEKLVAKHDELEKSAKARLGSLEAGMFPTRDELRSKYGFRMSEDVIANNSDIRLSGMSPAKVEAIAKKREEQVREQFRAANLDTIERIKKEVQVLHERMTEMQKPAEKGKRASTFQSDSKGKYPIFENISSMLDIAEHLNFNNDERLTALIKKVRSAMTTFNQDQCKESKLAREHVITQTKTVLDELATF